MDIITALEYLCTCSKDEMERLNKMDDLYKVERNIRHLQRIIKQLEFERDRLIRNIKPEQHLEKESRLYLTIEDVCKEFGITSQTLRNWKKQGVLIPKKIKGTVVYLRHDVEKLGGKCE